jgi:hypothetical protein
MLVLSRRHSGILIQVLLIIVRGALSKSNNKLTGVFWSEVRCFRLKFGLFLNLIVYRVGFLSLRGGHSYEEWI